MAKIVKTTKDDETPGKRRKASLASRAARRVNKRRKVLRPATYVVVGLAEVAGKAIKAGGKSVGRVGMWGGRKARARIRRDLDYRKWTSAPPKVAGKKWFHRSLDLECCGSHFKTVEAMNRHLVTKHRGEQRVFDKQRPKIKRSHTAKTAGKIIVRPKVAGGGRHRARHDIPGAKRATELIAAYQKDIAAVRKRVEKIMGSSESATQTILNRAGAAIGDITVDKKTKLSEFFDMLIGLEMGLNAIGDGIDSFGRMLRSERGANIDPALVRPYMDRAVAAIQESAQVFTQFVAAFEDTYRDIIKAERAKLETTMPKINLAG